MKEETTFPSKYLFKFIVKNNEQLILEVLNLFEDMGANFKKTPSKNNNFMSISVSVYVLSANEIIDKYKQAEGIEGIISL